MGVFSLLNIEIDLTIVAAFLTIVGYSLNDTIVVFDRIRENVVKHARESLDSMVNISLNSTLGRTIVTSLTTFVVVLSLFLFGGEVIKNFAFALIVGVFIGTYSSIYVASPVMMYFEKKALAKK
jgi:preprotein translocase subunit SecF